jgi:hypothetical protein
MGIENGRKGSYLDGTCPYNNYTQNLKSQGPGPGQIGRTCTIILFFTWHLILERFRTYF